MPVTPAEHAAIATGLIERLCMDSLDVPFERLLANREFHMTQDVSRMFLRLHDEVVALAERATEQERVLRRIADPTELTGDGPLEGILADPHGTAERELRARMRMAEEAL